MRPCIRGFVHNDDALFSDRALAPSFWDRKFYCDQWRDNKNQYVCVHVALDSAVTAKDALAADATAAAAVAAATAAAAAAQPAQPP